DLRILIGSVLPHLQAGFGGGYKLIFPGTSHRSTLGALHRMGLSGDAGRLLGGDAGHNPMRRAIGAAAKRLGPCFSLSHLMGAPIRRGLPMAERVTAAVGSPSTVLIRWARELVVDRTVLVYAPPLHDRVGPVLGPVRLFANQGRLWQAAAEALAGRSPASLRV